MSGTGPFQIARMADLVRFGQASAFEQYLKTRDLSVYTFAPSERPTIYVARLLTWPEVRDVRNRASEGDQNEAAFCRGLVKAEGLTFPNGDRKDWHRPTDHTGRERVIPDEALSEYFDEATVQEIGMVIRIRSFLGRGSEPWYPLPDTSRLALQASLLRRAAPTNAGPNSGVSSAPAEALPPTPPPSSPAGVASGVATVTG